MTVERDRDDPKGLIADAFAIEGISASQCRSILTDWLLSLDETVDPRAAMMRKLQAYHEVGDHPMRLLLTEGVHAVPVRAHRRGGWRGRR